MYFEIGDKVIVLDDVIKGFVTGIKKDIITIKDSDGMSFKYISSELVKIEIEQNELTKYSHIYNEFLRNKTREKSSKLAKPKKEIIIEVDLHINQLVKHTKGMDNFDMLNLQINTAQRKLEHAIKSKISKIVFIHGVGKGVLKSELYYLFSKYSVNFYDAPYQKYGLGATEVLIR